VKIISWNVNGIRAVLNRNLLCPFVAAYDPDVLCLQEVKAQPGQVQLNLITTGMARRGKGMRARH
jgi:exodeoxyribonuclease III